MRRYPDRSMTFTSDKEKPTGPDDTDQDSPNFLSEIDEENAIDELSAPQITPAKPKIGDPPNGGLKAWLQVLGAFFIYFNTWGKLQPRTQRSPSMQRKAVATSTPVSATAQRARAVA